MRDVNLSPARVAERLFNTVVEVAPLRYRPDDIVPPAAPTVRGAGR